jgi:hypothetical protein
VSRLVPRAGERLAALRSGPPTALLVPVKGLPFDIPAAPGLPHHVTVLYPFVGVRRIGPRLIGRLEDTFAPLAPFEFSLTTVRRFPGVLYLAPEPPAPLVALTERCVRQWPDHPPYRGSYPEIVPHLTLAEGPEPPGLAERVAATLPLQCRAEQIWLMAPVRRRGWRRAVTISFRGSDPATPR